ncbi:hypothetical protein [Allomuricauda sp. SCSIO 65647]|uniref:hypothetical protein n=1 Tax=Allomuricauda sp. SCSIO 65647 TaxID=2908843 RepID=UPI001F268A83|nr:hypothetical protein [Muricauda sp. SCSIO 65647]UJH67622.1 hypothetical protein L0P89_00020 [Muricauda sp. SCSIO 65647]
MRRWISFTSHLAILTVFASFVSFETGNETFEVPENLKVHVAFEVRFPAVAAIDLPEISYPIFLDRSFMGFKEALAFKESQGRYRVVNTLGYMGKYQFGANTLKLMGVYDTEHFLANPALQEQIFQLNVARNKWILRRDIKRFVGKRINGINITESGIVAAAHLSGAGNVKKYLRSYGREDFSDAYGSTIAYYMRKFEGYDISIIDAKRNPKI